MTAPGPDSGPCNFSLFQAILSRRSRRFGKGLTLNGGPLAYASQQPPQPLTLSEEAALAFAANGITGYTMAELPYAGGDITEGGSGNILVQFVGRPVASADAIHTVILFVLNDEGTWMLKRPQDYPRQEIAPLWQAAHDHQWVELYERSRVRIAATRLDVPRELPFVPAFNKWSANRPGTTYFLPVNELTALYINILLSALNEEFGYYVVDDRNNFTPAGLTRFARSRGGHLHDNPQDGRFGTVNFIETWLCEFTAIEQGGMLQNLGLMAAALGVGGFPHFAAHPYGWPQALGFRMVDVPLSRISGASPVLRQVMKTLKKDAPVPTAVGLEHGGATLIKPFCPPYYRNMEEAVLAFIDFKFNASSGTLRDGANTAWQDGAKIQAGIPRPADRTIAATIAYCDYVYNHYGRFPACSGPFRTTLAYQAHHLDQDFYREFYRPETTGVAVA